MTTTTPPQSTEAGTLTLRQKTLQIIKRYWWVYPLWWVFKLALVGLLGVSILS
ncbi:MAG: hypothetical protein VXZ96_20215 [Myxococcota bacterium]|nr:hypothetical protein [Myxococcota bacterium]